VPNHSLLHTMFALALVAAPLLAAETNDGAALMSEFGLRESAEPVSKRPNWQLPQRIVVDGGVPGLAGLQGAAPGVTFVAADSPATMQKEVAAGAEVVIGRTNFVCDVGVLAAGTELRWAQTIYSGVERCLPQRARFDSGVLLTNMRAVGAPVIAEHALALLFALTRGLHVSVARQSAADWNEDFAPRTPLVTLSGKTMLIVGLGGIGTEVGRRADALGMRVIGTRASQRPAPSFVRRVGRPEDLATLIGEADVVVNAAPLTPATQGLFNAQMFARMKPSAYFINVARGGAVVTADLAAALESRRIAGAGLDVVEPEPLPKNHPLWHAPNVIISPHVAGQSDVGIGPQLRVLRENIRRYVAGERMLSVVDLDRAY
jgi:phosphoglycerate dehydrogenase-like enzyme